MDRIPVMVCGNLWNSNESSWNSNDSSWNLSGSLLFCTEMQFLLPLEKITVNLNKNKTIIIIINLTWKQLMFLVLLPLEML